MRFPISSAVAMVISGILTIPVIAQQADLKYIPETAVGVVYIQPQRVMQAPNMELMPIEVITAAGLKEFGFDPMQIQSALILAEFTNPERPPGAAVLLRFAQGYDRTRIFPNFLRDAEDVEVAGVTYKRSRAPGRPAVALIDEKTALVGTEETVQRMLQAADSDGPLRRIVAQANDEHAACVYVTLEPLRDVINMAMAQLPQLPPPLEPFKKVPDLITHAELHVDVAEQSNYELSLHTASPQDAQKLFALAQQALAMGQQLLLQNIRQEMGDSDDPVAIAGMQYAERVVGFLFQQVQPQLDGQRVFLSVDAEANAATIGVAVALLLPAVQAAREAARRMQSMNNLKQICLAMHNYHDTFSRFPTNIEKDGKALLSWRVQILPFIEQNALYEQFRLDEPWDSPHNMALLDIIPAVYRNPNFTDEFKTKTNYLGIVAPGSLFVNAQPKKFSDIRDGSSNTVIVVEAGPDRAVPWTKPQDLTIDPSAPLAGLQKMRPGIFLALFADGSVQAITLTIDPKMLLGMFTIDGREVVRLPRN